jgi:D-tyrosyl-tRNA(Tyr) deacylase
MRAVVQRVTRSSVSVGGAVHSAIGKGLCVLLGVGNGDTVADTEWIVKKLLSLKLWPNEGGKEWALNVEGVGGEFLVVSQFTLFAKVSKGAKPDFHNAMPGQASREVYEDVLRRLREGYKHDAVKDCVFGAMMEVEIVNDGPVTIVLDTSQKDPIMPPTPSAAATPAAAATRAPAAGAKGGAGGDAV